MIRKHKLIASTKIGPIFHLADRIIDARILLQAYWCDRTWFVTIFFLVTVRFLAGWKISSFWGYFFFFSRQSPDPSIKRWKTLGLLSQSTQSLRGGHRKTGANLHEISKMAAVSEQWCISTRIFLILVILSTSANVHGWDSIDLELFDLVEEVKDNFYGVLGLKQVSTVVYFYFGWFWPQTGRILFG